MLAGMNEEKLAKAAASKPPTAPAPTALFDKLGPGLVVVLCGGGFLSTGSLIHDTNMVVLGAVFIVAGVGVAIARLLRK